MKRLGPPRIFVEVIREVEGGGALQIRKEISLMAFLMALIPLANRTVEECLDEVNSYGDTALTP